MTARLNVSEPTCSVFFFEFHLISSRPLAKDDEIAAQVFMFFF